MSTPSHPSPRASVWDDPRIVAPDEAAWSRMSRAERDAAIERVLAVFDEYREAMSEGVRHFRAKSGAAADLDGHFRRIRRDVFLACELAVLYPGEAAIVPDLLAVMDCDPDLDLDSWAVADRGRGIDVVVEVRNTGRKHKDLVENVRDYARLRIPEYFSFDCRSEVLRGWRLPTPHARSYQPVIPQGGTLASNVLGLDLGVSHGRLRFFANQALVPSAEELVSRLQTMADRSQRAAEEGQRAAEESRQAAAVAIDRAARALASLATSVLRLCERRGLALDDVQRARVIAEGDPERLARWLDRCVEASTADEIFTDS